MLFNQKEKTFYKFVNIATKKKKIKTSIFVIENNVQTTVDSGAKIMFQNKFAFIIEEQ